MKRNWIKTAAITGLATLGLVTIGGALIASKISYEVLSKHLLALDGEGITFRVNFGITNSLLFDIDIWNQNYDVFVAGRKTLKITAHDNYKVFSNSTSSIPLDVRLKWADFYANADNIGSVAHAAGITNLPIVIRGSFAGKIGMIRTPKIPVRMAEPLRYFLP